MFGAEGHHGHPRLLSDLLVPVETHRNHKRGQAHARFFIANRPTGRLVEFQYDSTSS
jgi:hypothetical protein